MFPPEITCQLWVSSSQMIVCVGLVNWALLASSTSQCHQSVAPGGPDPDWRISHVHSTCTSPAAVNCGKALATTVPQVNSSIPYSSTPEVRFAPALNPSLK